MSTPEPGKFGKYVFDNRKGILVTYALAALALTAWTYYFPQPDTFSDSFDYILWATYRFSIAYRPLGYSAFLRFIHFFSASSYTVVSVQFILIVTSAIMCAVSVGYLSGIRRVPILLLLVTALNPLLFFLANLIAADGLFCSLTVIWVTSCLWLIYRPGWTSLTLHLLLLFCCAGVRYSAMFYPLMSIAAVLIARKGRSFSIASVIVIVALSGVYAARQVQITDRETQTPVYSGFSGWQWANNALFAWKHTGIVNEQLPGDELRLIDQCVRRYIDSVSDPATVSDVFMWNRNSPLKKYLNIRAHRDHQDYLAAWFAASVPLGQYGRYITWHYPGEFATYFLAPNTVNFLYPNKEVLTNYDYGNNTLTPETKQWFGFTSGHLDCRDPLLERRVMDIYPLLNMLLVLLNIAVTVYFILFSRLKKKVTHTRTGPMILMWAIFFYAYMCFSIIAAVVNLRFQGVLFIPGLIIPAALIYVNRSARVAVASR